LHLAEFRQGARPPKMYKQCSSPEHGQILCKVWLASGERRRCINEGKTRNPLKFAGVSQTLEPISAVSWPKFAILWGHVEEILLFFFRLSIRAFVAKIQPHKVVRWCPDGELLATFLRPVFSASRVQQVSDLYSKFALRPHHVWKYGRHPICDG